MAHSYSGNAAAATGTTVQVTQPDDGDADNAAAQNTTSTVVVNWLQRLADIALAIGATAWTFTQAIIMQSTLAVTGAITGASIAVTGAVTGASATLSGALSAAAATFSGLLTGAAATFSGVLTANGGIAHATPLVVGGTGVSFQNTFAAAAQAPRYWKDPMGVVHMDGGVTHPTGTSGGVAFTLPGTHAPAVKQELIAWNVTTQTACDFVIETNGDVKTTIGAGNSVFFPAPTFSTF